MESPDYTELELSTEEIHTNIHNLVVNVIVDALQAEIDYLKDIKAQNYPSTNRTELATYKGVNRAIQIRKKKITDMVNSMFVDYNYIN